MDTSRIEAFSDGVLAVIITIMVLELKTPHSSDLASLRSVVPTFIAYVLSFSILGTYWNNHHHLIRTIKQVNGRVMWANLHLLFWLSLIPFFTTWLGLYYHATWPTVLYAALLLVCACAYQLLEYFILVDQPKGSIVARQVGRDTKGKLSLALYLLAVPAAFLNHWIADALFAAVAIIWFIPDRRLENSKHHS